jgi:CheY-like chemotaxis protein
MATILVVDDYSTSQRLMRFILQQSNHAVRSAVNGLQALEFLAETAFDLVITDLNMPEMDGLALLQHLRADERYQALPVIILTGSPHEQDNVRAQAAGATMFLTKPVGTDELITVVDQLLSQRQSADTANIQSTTPAGKGTVVESQILLEVPYMKRT